MARYAIKVGDPTSGPVAIVNLPASQFGTNAEGKLTEAQAGVTIPTAAQLKLPAFRAQQLLKQGHLLRVYFTIRPGNYSGTNNEIFTPTGTRVQKKSFIVENQPETISELRAMLKAAFGIGKIVKVSFTSGDRKSNV